MATGGLFLRKLRARVVDEPTGFVWVEKDRLAASGYPASKGQLRWLVGQGINSVLTLTRDPLPADWTQGLPLELGHIAMEDHQVPDVATLDRGAEYLSERLKEGKTVLVHCLAGEGRTGCVLAAYLIKEKQLGPLEALKRLREVKATFVERDQEKAVMEYGAAIR